MLKIVGVDFTLCRPLWPADFSAGLAMYAGKVLFAQLMDFLPWTTFARLVLRYGGDTGVRNFPCTAQYRAMAFAQLAYRESLRDIETCLSAQGAKLYHMGFAEPVCRSTLADANEARDWRIYAGLAQRLIAQARRLYAHEALGACGALPGFRVASLAPSARSHDERGKVLGRVL